MTSSNKELGNLGEPVGLGELGERGGAPSKHSANSANSDKSANFAKFSRNLADRNPPAFSCSCGDATRRGGSGSWGDTHTGRPLKRTQELTGFLMEKLQMNENMLDKTHDKQTFKHVKAMSSDIKLVAGERAVLATISTSSVDRDGDVLIPQGCNTKDYEKNPVVFLGHDYFTLPTAKVSAIKRYEDSIEAKVVFADRPEDHPEGVEWLPDTLYSLYKQGVMCAFSVGFAPTESRPATDRDVERFGKGAKRVFSKWSLLELSMVAIPANQDAVAFAVSKGLMTTATAKNLFGVEGVKVKHTFNVSASEGDIKAAKKRGAIYYLTVDPSRWVPVSRADGNCRADGDGLIRANASNFTQPIRRVADRTNLDLKGNNTMKVKKNEFEALLANAKSLSGEARTAFLATLKSAEVYDIDAEGNEFAIEAEIVDEQPEVKAAEVEVETKAAEAAVIAKARKTFSINSAPSKFKTPDRVKHARVKNFKSHEGEEFTPGERAYRFGQLCRAARGKSDAIEFCKENGIQLTSADESYDLFQKGANTYNNAAGGVWIPTEFDTDLILLREQFGLFRQFARVVPMGSDTKERMRQTGGLTAYFVGEGQAGTESQMSWDSVSLVARKLMIISLVTNEFSADATLNLGDTLAREAAYAFASKEDDCGFNGDGTSTYGKIQGVVSRLTTVNGVDDGGGIVLGTGNAYSELVLNDFHKVIARLPQYADQASDVAWYVSKTFHASVMAPLVTAQGGSPGSEVINGVRQLTFLGYPVRITQKMPSTAANSQVCALFGSMQLSTDFGDRAGATISFSDSAYVGSTSTFTTDQTAMRVTERFDINVHSVGSSTEAGPIVGLITAAS